MLAKLDRANLIIGIVVGILGTVATGTAIYTFFVSPYQLEAYTISISAPMSPKLQEELKGLNQFSVSQIRKRYSRDPDFAMISGETLDAVIPIFSKIIKDRLAWRLGMANKIDAQLKVINLRNVGRKAVRNVQVQMKYGMQASVIIDRGGKKKEFADFDGILKLGDMPPKAEFNIYLYSRLPYFENGIVSHDEGIAEISEYRPVPPLIAQTGGVFISYYWTTVVLVVIVGCMLILLLLRFAINRKKVKDA